MSPSDFDVVFGPAAEAGPLGAAVHDFFRQGGTVAVAVRTGDGDGDPLAALSRVGLFNLLVVPGAPPDLAAAAVALAEARGAMCILDPPAAWLTVEAAVAGAGDPAFPRSPNAAVYFPRIAQPGPLRGPAGAVAGVIARSDVVRGVWASPAGLEATLQGVAALEPVLTDADIARLNPLGVNGLRNVAGAGPVVWGARTTDTGPDWRFVAGRRTALFIEHSLARGLQWATFEPNGEALWARIRAEAGAFLDDLFRRDAFAGTTPRDAYLVKCDRETTTETDIDSGAVNVVVGFAPARPAEFVDIRLRLAAGGTPSR